MIGIDMHETVFSITLVPPVTENGDTLDKPLLLLQFRHRAGCVSCFPFNTGTLSGDLSAGLG